MVKNNINLGSSLAPCSSGMAAFPNLFRNRARELAMNEALERWALLKFWEEELPLIREVGNSVYFFFKVEKRYFYLTWNKSKSGSVYYGFSCSASLNEAKEGAFIEAYRNRDLLNELGKSIDPVKVSSLQEKRFLYFSSADGYNQFLRKIESCVWHDQNSEMKIRPEIKLDTEVTGPWSKYTNVWRIVLNYPEIIHSDKVDIFKF